MKKIRLNSKIRKFNSLVELVGEEVSVENENEIIQSEVESIKVTNDEVIMNLESGDKVTMDTMEAEELVETGEVATEVTEEVQDFEVTREVLDADGNVDTVTSIVEAPTEDEAIQVIKTLDSKRKRNSRRYKATHKENSKPESKQFQLSIGDDYIARFTICPKGTLLKLEIKKADETNDKFVEVETGWIGKELSMNDAFTAAEEAMEFRKRNFNGIKRRRDLSKTMVDIEFDKIDVYVGSTKYPQMKFQFRTFPSGDEFMNSFEMMLPPQSKLYKDIKSNLKANLGWQDDVIYLNVPEMNYTYPGVDEKLVEKLSKITGLRFDTYQDVLDGNPSETLGIDLKEITGNKRNSRKSNMNN